MRLQGVKVGFALTGSHCTLNKVFPEVKRLLEEGAELYGIISQALGETDTRFGKASDWKAQLFGMIGRNLITTITEAEPMGPQGLLDVLVIAPCTGNTMAKLANGIIDTPVLMAAKGHLRNQKPLVMAISTNDGLGANAKNLGILLNTKNIYLVPFGQDDPMVKPYSLVARMPLIADTVLEALRGRQLQPVLLGCA